MATGIPKIDRFKKIEDDDATFEISYKGKKTELDILMNTPSSHLTEIINIEGENTNQLLFGDNLNILKTLLENKDIAGKVRLIYIDPPYATRSKFQSRSQEDAYEDLLYGSKYLEFLRQRLIIMRELLAEDGSIYVHLDSNMAFEVKILMDEIFGEKNFKNWITRKKCNPKNFTRRQFGNISDYIMFYGKSNSTIFNRQFEPWTEETAQKEYNYIEEGTGRRYKKVPVHAPGVRNGETGQEWRGMLPPPGKHWQYTPKKLDEMDANGEIYWSPNGNPRRKVYLDNSKGISVQDIWLDYKDAHNQNIKITGYPTEKNPDLLKRIIQASSNEGDVILDAFAGSGTTLTVAEDLGRKWIGIDNSTLSIKTILKRLMFGSDKMGDFVQNKKETTVQAELIPNHILYQNGLKVYVDTESLEDSETHISEWKSIVES